MRRTDTESSSTWGTPRWLGWLGWILLVGVVVLLLVDVLSEGGVTWGSAGRSLSGLTVVGVILMSRIGTRATTSELETTGRGLRRRRIPWAQVSDLRPDKPNRWADVVEAHLVDGSTVPLQGVPPADLPRLQELRQRASQ
jgi:hypothetical protein